MITDERIVISRNEIAAQAFKICTVLLFIATMYRLLYLGQHPRECWDLIAVFFVGGVYCNIANVVRGNVRDLHGSSFPRLWERLVRILLIVSLTILALNLWRGRIASVADLVEDWLGFLIIVPTGLVLLYFLVRRRKRGDDVTEAVP